MAPRVRDVDNAAAAVEADVVASTLSAVNDRELHACIGAGLAAFGNGAVRRDVRHLVPPSWLLTLRHPSGHQPRTFAQLVAAVRHQWAAVESAPAASTDSDGAGTNPRAGG